VFIATPIDVVFNFVKFGQRKSLKSCIIYLTKKIRLTYKLSPLWITLKIFQDQPPTMYSECFIFHPNRFTFGGVLAERVNTAK